MKNIGVSDQGFRYCVAIIAAIAAFTRERQDLWFWLLCVVAGVIFLSALTGYSLLYDLIGENTLEDPRPRHKK